MTCLELLAACRARHREIQTIEERIRDAREAMTSVSVSGGGFSGHGSGGDRFAAHAARVDALQTRLILARKKLAAEGQAVILLTASMPDSPRRCLRAFYGKAMAPSAIAAEMGCTVGNVHKALASGRALAARIHDGDVEDALPVCYLRGEDQNA